MEYIYNLTWLAKSWQIVCKVEKCDTVHFGTI